MIRRPRPRRALAFAAAVLVGTSVLAACGTTADTGSSSGGSTVAGPGVTATTVKIGFITRKESTAAGGTGFVTAQYGSPKAQVAAIVKYINANGGIAGRQITPVVREFDSAADSVQTESALCTAFTQDDKVFAVVLVGQREPSARTCYQSANTLMIDAGGVPLSQNTYESLKPYLWAPSYTPLEPYTTAQVAALKDQKFLDSSAKVGVFVETDPSYAKVSDDVLKPAITATGATIVSTKSFDVSSGGTQGSSSSAAVNAFKAAGANRVIFLGRPDMVGFFTSIAAGQNYTPRLAIGTYEDPNFVALNPRFYPPNTIAGAAGVGFVPATDGYEAGFPAAGAETNCVNIMKASGLTFANRSDAKVAMLYCDAGLFLQTTAKKIGKDGILNADGIANAAAGLGDSWQSAVSLKTQFGANVYAPASAGRPLAYQGSTFTYTGPLTPFSTN